MAHERATNFLPWVELSITAVTGRRLQRLQRAIVCSSSALFLLAMSVMTPGHLLAQTTTAAVATVSRSVSAAPPGDVTSKRIARERSGDDWLVKGGGFYQNQFSPLKTINDRNVAQLGLAWSINLDNPMGLTAEPLVIDGIIYMSAPRSLVYAIDATSGRLLWKFDPKTRFDYGPDDSKTARINRGVAVWAGRVYVGTGDCRLIALNAATGTRVWEAPVCDPKETGITGAPRVAEGKVFIGYEAESFVRGSIVAFAATSGKELWRFWTVPGDPAKGFENPILAQAAQTWSGKEWWKESGGGVWDAITFDPTTRLVLFGTSKTEPYRNAKDERLFTGCIVAVHADTGRYAWHFRTSTPTRQSENFHITLADLTINGERRHVAMTVPRVGTFYMLDAATGHLISSRPLVPQGDPNDLVARGALPLDYPGVSIKGVEDCADRRCFGVRNWWPMSYSPETRLVYVPIMDMRRGDVVRNAYPMVGRLLAWDPVREALRWSVEHPVIVNSGVLSTAGNLVFQGQGTGEFDAYAADSGKKLWSVQTGSVIDAVPVTYRVRNEQYILVPVGWGGMFRLWAAAGVTSTKNSRYGPAQLLAFKLGGSPFTPPAVEIPSVPRPPEQSFAPAAVKRGQQLASEFDCVGCHSSEFDGAGRWAVNGGIPDLRYMPREAHEQWYAIVLGGSHRPEGMMPFAGKLSVSQADDIHAYVIDRAWAAYKAQ
jgi:quinohemoprotein ethanol dehydrogenase